MTSPELPPDPGSPEEGHENLPAVPGEVSREVEPVSRQKGFLSARAVYADITSAGERRPVIPVPLRPENLRGTVKAFAGLNWYRARVHGIRLPLYVLALLAWAVAGVFRLGWKVLHWWLLIEQHPLRAKAIGDDDYKAWLALHRAAQDTRRFRGTVTAAGAAVLAAGCAALALLAPWWAWLAAGLAALPLLARAGCPDGRRIISPAVIPPDYSPPTHEIITRALGSLGIAEINRAVKEGGPGITFVSDVMRDGPGWACHLDLPHGVSVSDILARREALASGLRRPLSATWPEGVPQEHPGRMNLWVGFHDISKAKPPAWPLLKTRQTDLFGKVPFGADPRGRVVEVPVFEVNWLIGAAPGQGKTSAVRGLACGAALDPLADLWIHELAGKGDLEPLARVCHRYVSGLDDASVGYAAESLRMLRGELDRRSVSLKKVDKSERPEGKVTRELAGRKHLRLRPLVAFFDEVQNLFTHPEHGDQAAGDAAYVIRLGRAYGVILILATQRPDSKTLPTAVGGNVTARFCLQVPGQIENDLILGTSSYKNGYNATAFRPKTDAGLGWLKADGPPQIVRTYKVDLPEAEKVAARARDMRDRAGVLSGYALGEADEARARDVLADVLAVFGAGAGLQWDELADRLAQRWPDRWADVTGEAVSAQCRAHGVPSVNVNAGGQVRKGCRKVAVQREAGR